MIPREYYIPGPDDYVIGRMPMISGQGEIQVRKFHKHIGKSGKIWLIADQPNSADNIYADGGKNSDGFGGATLEFPIINSDEVVKLKGPWHSNDSAFLEDTGIDISDKHYVMVVVGEDVKYGKNYETIIHKILYKDKEPILGIFHRGDVLGREWAQKIGKRVYVMDQTMGGESYRFIEPDAKFYWETTHETVVASPNQANIIMR